MRELLTTNPSKRLTASQALQHTWFTASLQSNEDLRLARRNMKRHLRLRFKVCMLQPCHPASLVHVAGADEQSCLHLRFEVCLLQSCLLKQCHAAALMHVAGLDERPCLHPSLELCLLLLQYPVCLSLHDASMELKHLLCWR